MVLVSLDGSALTKDNPKSLGESINKWTLAVLNNNEFDNVPEIL